MCGPLFVIMLLFSSMNVAEEDAVAFKCMPLNSGPLVERGWLVGLIWTPYADWLLNSWLICIDCRRGSLLEVMIGD